MSPPRDRPFRLCCHSSKCLFFDSASFFAYSIGMFLPSYAWRMGRTSGVLKIAMAIHTHGKIVSYDTNYTKESAEQDTHSRKGIMATSPLSFGSPDHFGRMTAFSGFGETCSG